MICNDSHFLIDSKEEDFDKWLKIIQNFEPKYWLLEDFTLRIWDTDDATFDDVIGELIIIIKLMKNDRLCNVCTISDYSENGLTGLLTVDYNGKYVRFLDAELNILKYPF